jgi:O-antigen ligase
MPNYITNLKNSQTYNKRLLIFACLLAISIFFPIRHVFLTKEAYLTGSYSDFTSFSLYLSDILLLVTWFLVILPRGRDFYHVVKPLKWLILLVFCAFLAHFGLNIRLNGYLLIKWLELIVAYGTFSLLFEQNLIKKLFLKLFVWLCNLESILALIQFARQSSIGLFKLGESHLSPSLLGVAKIVSGGTTFIRGYGLFPHPNPFSAFLVAGIIITIYLLTNAITNKSRILYSTLLFINILGLTVTFSRGAYLALATGLIIYFGGLFIRRHPERGQPSEGSHTRDSSPSDAFGFRMTPIVVIVVSIAISFFIFKPFLLTRATFSDQSTIARKFYDVTGIKMAEKNPIFGVGLGEGLLHMEQYTGKSLAPWDKQPPHNYFIIAAAKLGIPAMLILIWIFLSHLWGLTKKLRTNFSPYLLSLFSIFLSFLLLMQFDHYFYTLQQTQLLLWILLALIGTEIKTKNEPATKI